MVPATGPPWILLSLMIPQNLISGFANHEIRNPPLWQSLHPAPDYNWAMQCWGRLLIDVSLHCGELRVWSRVSCCRSVHNNPNCKKCRKPWILVFKIISTQHDGQRKHAANRNNSNGYAIYILNQFIRLRVFNSTKISRVLVQIFIFFTWMVYWWTGNY